MRSLSELFCWLLLGFAALGGRLVGSWIGRWTGARHAVAWFGALVGFAAAATLLDILWGDSVWDDLKDTSSAIFIYGIIAATIVEAIATAIELGIQSTKAENRAEPISAGPRIRFHLRSVFVIVILGITLFFAYRISVAPYFRFRETNSRIQASVRELAKHRPEGVSKRQWSSVVGWTSTAVYSVFFMPSSINDDQRYFDFADELDRRLQGKVEMSTIDWIWDNFEEIGKHGRSYSEQYRPTTPERLRAAEQMPAEIDVP